MNDGVVFRPPAGLKKIHSKDEFELCYLRHQYLRRAAYNPSKEEMKPYTRIVEHLAKNTFFIYRNLFHMVGMESEDIINVAMVQLVSFLGLYSLDRNPDKDDAFFTTFRKLNKGAAPSPTDRMNKDKANLTIFVKQRMEDVVRVCVQKARNIKGLPAEEFFAYYGPVKPPENTRELMEDHRKLGFKKIDTATFKSIKKRLKPRPQGPAFEYKGNWYIMVPIELKSLSVVDFSGAGLDPYDSLHNMTPEQILSRKESEEHWADQKETFEGMDVTLKRSLLSEFVEKHEQKPNYKDEIKAAKKVLRSLGA